LPTSPQNHQPGEEKRNPNDKWDKIKAIGSFSQAIASIITACTVTLLGLLIKNSVDQATLRSNRIQVYTQIMSQREQAESSLRKDMFANFIRTFTEERKASLKAQILNLELLSYNFHESLNLKPLFLDTHIQP
jgi:homoserine trans-succinylase